MLYDPEARKNLKEELLWLWEETRLALVALGRAREAFGPFLDPRGTLALSLKTLREPSRACAFPEKRGQGGRPRFIRESALSRKSSGTRT